MSSNGIDQVREYFAALGAGDVARAVATMQPGAELVMPVAAAVGHEAVSGLLGGFEEAFPDASFELKTELQSGSTVATEGVYNGTHTGVLRGPDAEIPPTGRRVSIPFANVAQIGDDGLIASHHAYWDQLEFLTQLGLV